MAVLKPKRRPETLNKFLACLVAGLFLAALFVASPVRVSAQENAVETSVAPVAIIGSSVISEEEVERIAAGRPRAYADLPADERRARITDTLVAEYVIDYYYGRDTQKLSPQVLDALNDARRQVLLQFFAQSQFTPPEITDAEVADFAARNPELFGDRRSYNFAIVTLSGGTVEARQAAQTRLQDMLEEQEIDIAALDEMVSGLQGDGVAAGLNTVWQTSEALGDDVLSRLDAMVRDNRLIDIIQQPDAASVLLLNSAVPIPADPAMLRSQIEQRLIAEAFDVHREDLIRRTAQTVLNPPEAAVEAETEGDALAVAPPPRGSVVWSSRPTLPRSVRLAALFGLGVFGVLSGSFLWLWLRKLWNQYPLLLRKSLLVPTLRKRSTGGIVAVTGAAGLLGGAGVATLMSIRSFGVTTTSLTLAGSIVAALALAGIMHMLSLRAVNRAVEEEGDKYADANRARRMLALKGNPLGLLAAAFGCAVLYGISLVLLLDGPLRLS